MEPKVIYENEHLVLLDKPAGWLTHADRRATSPTVADWLLARYPALVAVGEPMKLPAGGLAARPGIVHRLDQGTSGVMVVAKDQVTYFELKESFRARRIKKCYRLIVHGVMKNSVGAIDTPIGRSRRHPARRVADRRAAGLLRAAVTDYRVLATFRAHTYLEAYPLTGRTHQLRVHFKSIQHPLVGDRLYAGSAPALISRTALHAYCLELPPAMAPAASIFIAPLPLDFFAALALLRGL